MASLGNHENIENVSTTFHNAYTRRHKVEKRIVREAGPIEMMLK
jgi:hypothetical protein